MVLSSQRVDPHQALFNTMKSKDQAKNDAVNPLVNSDGKLIPSVTRVFRLDRSFEVFLQAYVGGPATTATSTQPSAPVTTPVAAAPLVAFVDFFRNGSKAIETHPVQALRTGESRLGIVPVNIKVALTGLEPGEYQCQVTVLDPSGSRAAFWQGAVMLAK